jgi:hypothetical protein
LNFCVVFRNLGKDEENEHGLWRVEGAVVVENPDFTHIEKEVHIAGGNCSNV